MDYKHRHEKEIGINGNVVLSWNGENSLDRGDEK